MQNRASQCDATDFDPTETSNTVLVLRLPRRFVKLLIAQQTKPSVPKLKVQISSDLLSKLFQSIHLNGKRRANNGGHRSIDQFTIQSQFGRISACLQHEHCNAAVERGNTRGTRLPSVRHVAKARSQREERRKMPVEKATLVHASNRRKRSGHLFKSRNTSDEERSSLTNVASSSDENSSDQTKSAIRVNRNRIRTMRQRS